MLDDKMLRAIRILALQATEEPTSDQTYSKICRWFSREFSTPLKEVEDYAVEYVLQHFFEDRYQSLYESSDAKNAGKYLKEREEILDPEGAKAQEEAHESWVDDLMKEAEEQNKAVASKDSNNLEKPQEFPNLIDNRFKLPDSGNIGE